MSLTEAFVVDEALRALPQEDKLTPPLEAERATRVRAILHRINPILEEDLLGQIAESRQHISQRYGLDRAEAKDGIVMTPKEIEAIVARATTDGFTMMAVIAGASNGELHPLENILRPVVDDFQTNTITGQ